MTNITLDGLPAKTGTISDSGIIHYREAGVDKKMTVADFLIKISEEYSTDINTFLGAADKAAGRAALEIARRTTVNNTNYTIIATDKVVAQTGTMTAARTFTLPSAALYPAGEELIIIDQSGTVTPANKISVARSSTDTIDGYTSKDITSAYGFLRLISNGSNSWKIASASPATTTTQGISFSPNPITISNNATDANNDIDFSAGNFEFSDGSGQTVATAIMTKRLDATWVAGNNNGGLLNGTAVPKAMDSTYHCYKIFNPTTGVEDSAFLLGVAGTAPDPTSILPSGYTKFSYRGSIITDASGNIRQFKQDKNKFELNTYLNAFSGTSPVLNTDLTLPSPVGIEINVILGGKLGHAGLGALYYNIKSKVEGDNVVCGIIPNINLAETHICPPKTIKTNTSAQIQHGRDPAKGSADVSLVLIGWVHDNIKFN